MNLSKGRRIGNETVSFETLKEKLPKECYEAVLQCDTFDPPHYINSDLQLQFFNACPVKELNDEEKKELFEQLGDALVKDHYSTDQLREFLDTRKLEISNTAFEENTEYKEERIIKRRYHE